MLVALLKSILLKASTRSQDHAAISQAFLYELYSKLLKGGIYGGLYRDYHRGY